MTESINLILSASTILLGVGVGFWLGTRSSKNEENKHQEAHTIEKRNLEERIIYLSKDLEQRDQMIEEQRESISGLKVLNAQLDSQVEHMHSQVIPDLRQERSELNRQLEESRSNQLELEKRVSVLGTSLDDERQQTGEKLKILEDARDKLREQFENLANSILEKNAEKFKLQNKENLDSILNPFKEKLAEFHKTVHDTHREGSNDRLILKEELKRLKSMNERLSEDANNLTNALKGDSKTRGIWGEMVLQKILENSGLHKGREYDTQVNVKDEEGTRYIPDVIIHLPDNKDLVIDSKVSLNAWEKMCSASTAEEKESHLKAHILSLRTHIKQLSEKSYEELEGIQTLDYVLMFIPIETAFLSAMDHEPGLFDDAFKKRIVMVTPSTLMVTLRTIENIWRYEKQNQNAQEIALQAGRLYDKFVGFLESMEDIGKSITRAKTSWDKALTQLSTGRGSLVSRAENMKRLGISTKKSLPAELLDEYLPGPDQIEPES